MGSQPTPSSKDTDTTVSLEEETACECVIFPVDPLSTDSISVLLATYPNAKVVERVSASGWGMLYWEATLLPNEIQELWSHQAV